ncbi:GNAT family N-acetyltransferase [Allonocardiopsis opalescens]|uniref:Acetyltransferase (GNAT) family protein n=1 Tax=Allonocardiopsis opalescens TaxID=1144618 RepID=A0A2T0QES3_9ACTN|nr:GNAT family N-acetyltransferase [Allonocardiopsis opalescens]PRY02418.1 acetyltransferase (GNAT) family protein [Allonocardiopsis opalescens]
MDRADTAAPVRGPDPADAPGPPARDRHEPAVANARELWTRLGRARGLPVRAHPCYLAVDGGPELGGLRVLVGRTPPGPAEAAAIAALAAASAGPAVVEDHSGALTADDLPGFTPRTLPVMVREPGPANGGARGTGTEVREARGAEELRTVERIIVDGFPVPPFQPYSPGRLLPGALLGDAACAFLSARREGADAGCCLLLRTAGATGVYWVATLPEHRSRGVGRAIMAAAIARSPDLPLALCATAAGEPLYRSLGFTRVAESTWWSKGR